ncbi:MULTISPECIES: FHA domain-containing protein [Alteromonas]|uniref:FHA domain-containing protein n=1 Tax=Alteromonas TaxID=226 RepID=UPI001930D8A4|nr:MULTISPECIES: FHA domain-containing protein [Alteromonas]
MKNYVIFVAVFLLCLPVYANTIVNVDVLDDGKSKQSGIATLVADETLIINQRLLAQGNQYLVTDPTTGAKLIGNLAAEQDTSDLALLKVKGLTGTPFTLAYSPLEKGRNVYLLTKENERQSGTVHSILPADKDHAFNRVQHTVLLKEGEFGAPLLNNCGHLAGISQNDTKGIFDSRLKLSDTFGVTTSLNSLQSFLTSHNVMFNRADSVCKSELEQLADLAEQEKKQAEALAKKQEEKKSVEAALKKLQQEDDAKKKALEEAEAEKARQEEERLKAEEALKEAQSQTEAQQKKLEEAELAKQAQEEKIKTIEQKSAEKQKQHEEEQQAEKQKLFYYAIPVIILLIIILIALHQRRKKLKEAEQEASANKHQLSVEKAKFESAKEELEIATATFSDIVLHGTDEDGNEQRVKIIGNTLAQSTEGILIGRSAQKATYVINVPGVSREHLLITLHNGNVMVKDLGSANGTSINGNDLVSGTPVSLNSGDTIKVGTVTFTAHFLKD